MYTYTHVDTLIQTYDRIYDVICTYAYTYIHNILYVPTEEEKVTIILIDSMANGFVTAA